MNNPQYSPPFIPIVCFLSISAFKGHSQEWRSISVPTKVNPFRLGGFRLSHLEYDIACKRSKC